MPRTLYIDESGNDAQDVDFVVVGVEPDDRGALTRGVRALRARWPFLGDGLKASRVSSPGWLAARWLRAAPKAPTGPPRVELFDLEAAAHDRVDALRLLERGGATDSLPTPAELDAIGLGPTDRAFGWWAAAIRRVARSHPLPSTEAHRPLAEWWHCVSPLLSPRERQLPLQLRAELTVALFAPGATAWVGREQAPGALRGAPDRYLKLLGAVIQSAVADGIDRCEVQGRHVPRRSPAGTRLEGAHRPLQSADLVALGAPAGAAVVVDFAALDGSRPAHLLADAAAWACRRPAPAAPAGLRTVTVVVTPTPPTRSDP